jgi:hypothetical protein
MTRYACAAVTALGLLATTPVVARDAASLPQPFVNQAGYNTGEAKRFVLPNASDGVPFAVIRLSDGAAVFRGTVKGQGGDFSAFDEPSAPSEYVIEVQGWPRSHPFTIASQHFEKVSSRLAYQFFIDVRGGFSSKVSPANVTGGGPARDGGGSTLEPMFLGLLYASNPALFDRWTKELRYFDDRMYAIVPPDDEAKDAPIGYYEEKSRDKLAAPDLLKLIVWNTEWAWHNRNYEGPTAGYEERAYAYDAWIRSFGHPDGQQQSFDRQNLLDYIAAGHAYQGMFLKDYLPKPIHTRMRNFALSEWEDSDRHKEVRYWTKSMKWIDEGRLEFNEMGSAFGQGLWRNLMMYLGEKQTPGGDPERFAKYVRATADDIIANWDFNNPVHMWRARNAEHMTPQALAMLQMTAPELAPAGLMPKLRAWRDYVMKRSDNLWHYRTHDDREWAHPKSKEVGTVAGMGGSMFAVAHVLKDPALRARAWSQVNYVFGANPAGTHLGNDSRTRRALGGWWQGVERGWPISYVHGTGALGYTRGTLDGSPTNDAFPYNPAMAVTGDKPGVYGTEGWALTNRAWLTTVAFATLDTHGVRIIGSDGKAASGVRRGAPLRVELRAALNLDPTKIETGYVDVARAGGAMQRLVVTETGPNSDLFAAPLDTATAGNVTVSYGHMAFRKTASVTVR